MDKKGFTYIEFMGVLSILALISILTIPIMSNVLQSSKKNQYESFKNEIFLACETYISVNKDNFKELKTVGNNVYISLETLMQSGYLKSTILDPKKGVKIIHDKDYTVIVTLNEDKTFDFELREEPIYHPYNIGDIVYYDLGDGKIREFNVISDSDEQNQDVTILLSKNLGSSIWNSTGNDLDSPITAIEELNNLTSEWRYSSLRLLNIDDLTNILGVDQINSIPYQLEIEWLYKNLNTNECYWTSSKDASSAIIVTNGKLGTKAVTSTCGLRPVVTIKKQK